MRADRDRAALEPLPRVVLTSTLRALRVVIARKKCADARRFQPEMNGGFPARLMIVDQSHCIAQFSFAKANPTYRVGASVASHDQNSLPKRAIEAHPPREASAFVGCRRRTREMAVR